MVCAKARRRARFCFANFCKEKKKQKKKTINQLYLKWTGLGVGHYFYKVLLECRTC
jgi:hypothetical protein